MGKPDPAKVASRKGYKVFYLDLETEGLTSHFWTKGLGPDPMNVRRERVNAPRISEIALRDASGSNNVFGYTDIVTKKMLERHGVTSKQLRDMNARLAAGVYRELVGDAGPALWDPSVAIDGSVLNKGFRRHARFAARNRVVPTTTLIESVVSKLEQASAASRVTLQGWNITGFDLPVLFGNASADQASRLASLITSGALDVRESSENYHRVVFNRLFRGDFRPAITNRAALHAAKGLTIKTEEEASRFLRTHSPLMEFAADLRGGRAALEKRMQSWASRYQGTNLESRASKIASKVARRLSKVTDYDSYLRTVTRAQLASETYMRGWTQSMYEIVGSAYGRRGAQHTHVFGDLNRVRGEMRSANKVVARLSAKSMAGKVHALQFVMGGQQEEVARSMISAMQQVAPTDPRLPELIRAVRTAHAGRKDTRTLQILGEVMAPKPENAGLLSEFERVHFDETNLRRMYTRRVVQLSEDFHTAAKVNEIFQGGSGSKSSARIPGTDAAKRRGFLSGTIGRLREFFLPEGKPATAAMRIGAAAIGIGLLANALGPKDEQLDDEDLKKRRKKRVEGIRRPRNMYQMVEGIDPSEMEYANVSSFHSGANVWEGMMTASFLGQSHPWTNPYMDRDKSREGIYKRGRDLHASLEAYFINNGLVSGVEQPIYQDGISGVVDAMVQGGIPFEIKSVGSSGKLASMSMPRGQDIGQINFDILATGAPYGYVAYAAPDEPLKYKLFKILPDPGRLARDSYFLESRMKADQRIPQWAMMSFISRKISATASSVQEYLKESIGLETQEYNELEADDPFQGQQEGTFYAGDQRLETNYFPEPVSVYDPELHPLAMARSANLSKIRDYKTQLQHLPGLPRTARRRNARPNMASLTERL